jgi:glycosyltransferase involved in cell wall biosynthesis
VTALRICFPFVGDTIGGSHISALELIKALPHEGVEPVIVIHRNGHLTKMLSNSGIGFEMAPEVKLVAPGSIAHQLITMTTCAPRLADFLRSRAIKIVHTNDARMHLTWGPAARLAGASFVWHQRSTDPSRRLSLYSYFANEVLTISKFCKSELTGSLGRRARVVTNPFDTGLAPPDRGSARKALLDALNLPDEACVVGYFSNFMARKRPEVFVEIAARLRQRIAMLVCPMFGDARERREVDDLIAVRGLENTCPVMGFRTPVTAWMAACDVTVAPAVEEPHGRTLIESMLAGTPVIAAADGGHTEIIAHGETGLLVEPDNVEAFEAAVLMLLGNPWVARVMADRARAHALNRYSAQTHAKAIVEVYRGVGR